MVQSMTGYGRAEGSLKGHMLFVEIRSVNHRHCNVVVRLPRLLSQFEDIVKKKLHDHFERGRLDMVVSVNVPVVSNNRFELNLEAATAYYGILKQLKQALHLSGEIDITLMSQFRDVITVAEPDQSGDFLETLLLKTLGQAMTALGKMQKTEGRALVTDLLARLKTIAKHLSIVKKQENQVILSRQNRLKTRVSELTSGIDIDPLRLAQEIAIFAERSDISEERTRLKAHLDHFKQMLRKGGAIGRSLDFLLQEMFREVNTLSAKSGDQTISMAVVAMKSELEKMREQVQNIA